mmetsp:Transcript_48433/g.121933  ORF Transcript_48433/g.121933 Transcript_48433/m.121933 type:complete len:236 (+) Transcript_48433:327-1034(+)
MTTTPPLFTRLLQCGQTSDWSAGDWGEELSSDAPGVGRRRGKFSDDGVVKPLPTSDTERASGPEAVARTDPLRRADMLPDDALRALSAPESSRALRCAFLDPFSSAFLDAAFSSVDCGGRSTRSSSPSKHRSFSALISLWSAWQYRSPACSKNPPSPSKCMPHLEHLKCSGCQNMPSAWMERRAFSGLRHAAQMCPRASLSMHFSHATSVPLGWKKDPASPTPHITHLKWSEWYG